MATFVGTQTLNYQEIVVQLRHKLPDILADYPVNLAYLHGSLARKQVTALSDVDIALVTEQNLPPLTRLNLELDIEIALSAIDIPQADVRVINLAPPAVRGRIVTEGLLLYCNDKKKRIAFETQSRSEYFDLQPVLKEQWRAYVKSTLDDLHTRGLI